MSITAAARASDAPAPPGSSAPARSGSSRIEHASLIAVLAYAGLRPAEVLALRWSDVRERTILVERSLSLGGSE